MGLVGALRSSFEFGRRLDLDRTWMGTKLLSLTLKTGAVIRRSTSKTVSGAWGP